MDKIVSLAKRRGFVFPGSEIYGGLANSWDYGPLGTELKNNIKQLWWRRFVQQRDDVVGIDAALIMNPKVWEASGHLKEFSDPLVECKKCHQRFRADQIQGIPFIFPHGSAKAGNIETADVEPLSPKLNPEGKCPNPNCGASLEEAFGSSEVRQFNLMLKTFLGPLDPLTEIWVAHEVFKKNDNDLQFVSSFNESVKSQVYFRPETAQAMFVDFKNVLETSRKTLPFGIAQIGKAFRNEITPGNFIFRTREFEQMEIEYFIREEEWEKWFEHWRLQMKEWMTEDLGLAESHIHEVDIPDGERAHYSKKTIDFEYEYPFGRKELYGLAYRTDFDLKNHYPNQAPYKDQATGEEFWPHVIEPTWGVDRSVLAVLLDSYTEEGEADKKRVFLKLPPKLAPYKAAVFPLLANKPELVELARSVYDDLKKDFMVAWDDRGNIGKRYYSQDEIGTPYCITVDFDSLEKNDVTVRDRNTAKQDERRVPIAELGDYLREKTIQ